ncbi:hypothetical protein C9928_05205 [Pseudidiomarina aestuarii]|uniref:Uncharacterized protein n=1 Tax=Pseudidiomarina aestuarii TaxID=624146 RepID=A0A6N4DHL5_9GAMM|nr:hypothetical protein C9928_05205 [Pseudidiomarina aestuarii]
MFQTIKSRIKVDNAIFTFGETEINGVTQNEYLVFCAGANSQYVEWLSPLKDTSLLSLISTLREIKNQGYKGKVKIKKGWFRINLHFLGVKPSKGIKVKANFSGCLFYSGAFGSSYINESVLEQLVSNLENYASLQDAV